MVSSFDLEEMKARFNEDIQSILELTEYKDYIVCLSGSENFRKKHFPTYKTNRVTQKPVGYSELLEWVKGTYGCKYHATLEGDDIMGILCTRKDGSRYAIYSIDKDMKTIPTKLWDFKDLGFFKQSKLEALRFLYSQVLTGDATDGYKGCPRVGKVGAEKLLKNCKDELDLLLATLTAYFKEYGYGYTAISMFLEQIGQARILHSEDFEILKESNSTYNPLHLLIRREDNGNDKKRTQVRKKIGGYCA